jgi:predicted SnoaL-like aldol condensation-catalyzing enzyme
MVLGAIVLPASPLPPPATNGEDVVHRFYAAVNDAIATGDPSRLYTVVASHFVARDPLPGVEPGRSGLERYLLRLHQVDPGLRLVPDVVVAAGDLTVAHVTARSDQEPQVLAGAMTTPRPWGTVDVLRVAGDFIVERWGDTDGIGLVRPLAELAFDLPTPLPRVVTIDRLTLAPGARWSSHETGPHLLLVEEGVLGVEEHERETTVPQGSPSRQAARLAAEEWLLIPAGAAFVMTNLGAGATRVAAVTFAVPRSPGGAPVTATLPPGVAGKTLAGGLAADVEVGPAILTVAQMMLDSGAQVSFAGDGGPVLLVVDAGRLSMTGTAPAWIRSGAAGNSRRAREATLAPGDGALLSAGGFTVLQNAGEDPVLALVVVLQTDATTTGDANPLLGHSVASNRDPPPPPRSSVSLTSRPFDIRDWLYIGGLSRGR